MIRECWVENHIGMVPLNNGKEEMNEEVEAKLKERLWD